MNDFSIHIGNDFHRLIVSLEMGQRSKPSPNMTARLELRPPVKMTGLPEKLTAGLIEGSSQSPCTVLIGHLPPEQPPPPQLLNHVVCGDQALAALIQSRAKASLFQRQTTTACKKSDIHLNWLMDRHDEIPRGTLDTQPPPTSL